MPLEALPGSHVVLTPYPRPASTATPPPLNDTAVLLAKTVSAPSARKLLCATTPPPLAAATLLAKVLRKIPRKARPTYAPPPLTDAVLPTTTQPRRLTSMTLASGGRKTSSFGCAYRPPPRIALLFERVQPDSETKGVES